MSEKVYTYQTMVKRVTKNGDIVYTKETREKKYIPVGCASNRLFKRLSPDGSGKEILEQFALCNYSYAKLSRLLGVSRNIAVKVVTLANNAVNESKKDTDQSILELFIDM